MKKYKDFGIYDFSDYAEEITGEDLIKINGGSSSCNGSGPENGGVSAASGGSGSKGSGSPLIGASSGSCGGSPSVPSGSSGNSGSGFSTSGSGSGSAPSSNTGSCGGSISSGADPNVPNLGTPSGSTQTSSEYHGVPPQHWAALDEQKEKNKKEKEFSGVPTQYWSALYEQKQITFKYSTLSNNTRFHIKQLKPEIRTQTISMLYELKKQAINVEIVSSYRSFDSQNELYEKGRRGIIGEKIVTNAKGGESIHNYRLAFDVEVYDKKGKKDWDFEGANWQTVIEKGTSKGFESGYYWSNPYDPPHFQDTKGKSLSQLQKENKSEN